MIVKTDIEVCSPSSINEACRVLSENPGAKVLAGGTDLMIQVSEGLIRPSVLVDVSRIPDLQAVREDGTKVVVGAMVRYTGMLSNELLQERAPFLLSAVAKIGSWQIRNVATMAGNVAHASPSADTVPPLFASGGELHCMSVSGDRWVPITDVATGPGATTLRDDELVTEIRLDGLENGEYHFFSKLGQRKSLACSKVSVALRMVSDGEKVTRARIALGAVAPTVLTASGASELLQSGPLSRQLVAEVARRAAEESVPISDHRSTADYRRQMVEVLVRRGLEESL